MHEVSIAQTLLHTLEEAARDAGIACVTRMQIELGEGAGLAPDALSFALQVAGQGSIAEGAEVVYAGPGAGNPAEDEDDHLHGDHSHAHDHAHDEPMDLERYAVRLAWIEGM